MESTTTKTPIKENVHESNHGSTNEMASAVSQLSPPKDGGSYGAAFSLASLDQGNNRSGGSLLNLSAFDTGVFLKSGSFDSLHNLLGSQFFKQEGDKQIVIPPLSSAANLLNTSGTSLNLMSQFSSGSAININKTTLPAPVPSNALVLSPSSSATAPLAQSLYGNALIQPKNNDRRMIERKDDSSKQFVDVTPFLTLPQHEAAKKLGIPSSTLAKRWKEASCNRKWPYRTVSKLDKEILTLLKNVESAKAELSPSVEATLGSLLKKRNEELKTVLVRL